MELREILRIIWKRLWLIGLGTVLISIAVFTLSKNMKPVYRAKVTMIVNQSSNAPLSDYSSILTGGNLLALTYSELLKTRPLLEIVIANLNLDLSSDDLVENMISTSLIPETQLLELKVEDTDAQRARDIANEIAFTFVSLHNTEQQLQNISDLEQNIMAQMANLEELIEYNQKVVDKVRTSGLLVEEESSLVQSTLSSQQGAYASLLVTYLNIRLTQAQLLDISVVEPAVVPATPIRPNIVLYTFLGAFVGLVFSAGLAFLLEYLDRSFETSDDVQRVLPLPVLGTIPRLQGKERNNHLVTSILPRAPSSEAYRALRTNIRFASVDEPVRALLVTSPEPGVGKTTVAANLAIVCAQAGLQVVLIDADLRLPRLHKLFDLRNHNGLTDLLVGDIQNVEECMIKTKIDNLRLITSGPIPPNPSELLGSKRMESILTQIRENADLVVIDTPPTLVVTDAAILASRVEGVILLIEAKRTSHEMARRAYEAHQRVDSAVLGTVLTKARIGRRDSSYYYYAAETQPSRVPIWKRLSKLKSQ